jgi:hypothetical protein
MNIILVSILCGLAHAWDNQGHRIIGLIAGQYVKDRTAVYLEDTIEEVSRNAIPEGLGYVSIQADMKQNDTAYAWASAMHYAYTDEQCNPFNEKSDCPAGVCIVTAIAKFSTIASDPNASLSDRQEALMFLIHFMGDIHQPLHVGFWKDQGGSKLWLSDPDTHLHDVWDSVIVSRFIRKEAPKNLKRKWNYYTLAQDLVNEMEKKYDAENQAHSVPVPSDTSNYKLVKAYAADIASETTSHYTCKYAYRNERGWLIQPGDMLTKTYLEERWKIVKTQYMVAGYRLAMLLDSIAETFAAKSREIKQAARVKVTRSVPETKKTSNRFADLQVEMFSDSDESTDDDDKKKLAAHEESKKLTFSEIIKGSKKTESNNDKRGKVSKSHSVIKKSKGDKR